jgi:hypothetical protein
LIASYKTYKENIENEIKQIDEKYRLLAEAEKDALSSAYKFYDSAIASLSLIVENDPKIYGSTTNPAPAQPEKKEKAKAEPEEEKVVDNLFPENNETETKEDETVKEETPAEEPEPEFDGAGFTSEDEPAPADEADFTSGGEPVDPNDWGSQVTGW